MKVIVIIPAHNEEQKIGSVVTDIFTILKEMLVEVVVVDDGSTDRTAQIATEKGAYVVSHPIKFGLAETFRTEVKTCLNRNADIIVHIDADGQYLPSEIPKLLKGIDEGYDMVLGSRFLGTIEDMPSIKRIGNKLFSRVVSQITGLKITDAQTGFRAFKREVAQNIDIISNHTYTQEQIIKAARKYKIKEVPVYFAKRDGPSRLIKNPFEYAIRAFITIIRIYRDFKPLSFFGLIGGIPLVIGSIIGIWFSYEHFLGGGVKGHLLLSIFMMLLVLVGIQIILFGFLADMKR